MKYIRSYHADWGMPNWELSEQGIRCRADAIGANVYEFKTRSAEIVRVLAHNKDNAKDAAEKYVYETQLEND